MLSCIYYIEFDHSVNKIVVGHYNDRVELDGLAGPDYVTKNGTRITADTHFVCIGKRVGSSWLRNCELGNLLDGEGRLKVDANLRVEGKSNIFAIGDIANTKVCTSDSSMSFSRCSLTLWVFAQNRVSRGGNTYFHF